MMDLDQLQSVRDRERQTDKLQQLRDSFYADAADLVADLREERDRAAAEAEDPFDDPRVGRLTDQIDTAEQTVEAIYEKRVGKLVKAASFAAADLPAETEGMTTEEMDLFDDLVADIRANRQRVLDVLAGEASSSPDSGPTPDGRESGDADTAAETDADGTTAPADVDAASLMGGEDSPPPPSPPTPNPDQGADADENPAGDADPAEGTDADEQVETREVAESDHVSKAAEDAEPASANSVPEEDPETGQPPESRARSESSTGVHAPPVETDSSDSGEDGGAAAGEIERTTVRITTDVGEIFGVDERAYHLEADQIVTLPAANAEPLLEQDAAERVD